MAVKKTKGSEDTVRDEIFRLIKEGKLPEVRVLTRKERKELTKTGFNMYQPKVDENTNFLDLKMKCVDWVVDNIYPDFDWDDVPSNVVNIFVGFTLGLTYGDNFIEKN